MDNSVKQNGFLIQAKEKALSSHIVSLRRGQHKKSPKGLWGKQEKKPAS